MQRMTQKGDPCITLFNILFYTLSEIRLFSLNFITVKYSLHYTTLK